MSDDAVAKCFALNMNCVSSRSHDKRLFEFYRKGQGVVAVGEVEVCDGPSSQHPTHSISKAKIDSVFERWHPTPFMLIVKWADGIYWLAITDRSRQSWAVRIDGDGVDGRYHIPMQGFTRLKFDGID